MLNGVDVAALRRLAADVRQQPWDAQVSARVLATRAGRDRCSVRVQPSVWGAIRVVRPFVLDVAVTPSSAAPVDPVTTVLTALGACVATTAVTSLTTQGVEPVDVRVVTFDEPRGTAGERRIGYDLMLAGPVEPAAAVLAAQHVAAFSPVHRTVAGERDVRVVVASADDQRHDVSSPRSSAVGDATATPPRRSAELRWQRGFHATGGPAAGDPLDIDQPKQLHGGDLGPSPLECVVAALAAEALGTARSGAAEAHGSARLDLRSFLGVGDAAPGALDVLVQLIDTTVTGDPTDAAALDRWLASGPALALVRDAHPLDVTLRVGDDPVPLQL